MKHMGISSQNKRQEALIKALRTKDSDTAVRAFLRVADDLKQSKTEYIFPIALNVDITKYESPAHTPSHINICVEYNESTGEFDILYRVMNLNDQEIRKLSDEELIGYIDENGGISVGASMAHGRNILEARIKMMPSQNKPVSEITKQISIEVQEALVSGVIPDNASIFMPLVNQEGIVPVSSYGGYAEGLRVKGASGAFVSDVSSEENMLIDHIGVTGLNRKGQVTFSMVSVPGRKDEAGGMTPLGRMDRDYIAFGERDITEYTDTVLQAVFQLKSLRYELKYLISSINDNYEKYQQILKSPDQKEDHRKELLNRMARTDLELRNKLDELVKRSNNGRFIDFTIQDPFGMMSPRGYILERSSYECVIGADYKIQPGYADKVSALVDKFNCAVEDIQNRYSLAVEKRNYLQQEYLAQEKAMTGKHGPGVTALAINASDTYNGDLERLKGVRDEELCKLAESDRYRGLFTDSFHILDQGSRSKTVGVPFSIFINPYISVREQDNMIREALSLDTRGDRKRKEDVLETIKTLMRDSMDIENSTGNVSAFGMIDVYEILNEHCGQIVRIKDSGQEWRIRIVKSATKGRDFEFIDPDSRKPVHLTELFVACHLKPEVTLTTEICHGNKKTGIASRIKGFLKGKIGEAIKIFQKNVLSPDHSEEAIAAAGLLSPDSLKQLKEANLAIRNAVNAIRESSIARFEEYKVNELNILAAKLNIPPYRGPEVIAEKALSAGLINGDKKYNLVCSDAGEKLFGDPEELAGVVASKSKDVRGVLGTVYQTYENLAHVIKDNISLSVEARKDGEIIVKKDLIFPRGKMNKPILIEYEKRDDRFVALPAKNITKEAAMDVIAIAVEAQIFSPFQQAIVKTVDLEQAESTKGINEVLKGARESSVNHKHIGRKVREEPAVKFH